jgi:aerobic-type carbon monoxide dehydrogenase small subunit (CoxS/CutS family)
MTEQSFVEPETTPDELSTDIETVVNGRPVHRRVRNRATLAQFLRDDLGLTGTKLSCELQVCGVCSVLVDDRPISACTYLAVDVDGRQVRTVEGLACNGKLNPLQSAFVENFALQCGFCTAGFLMMSTSLLERNPDPSEHEVVEYLDGNICRCTGYEPIVHAVLDAAQRMRTDAADSPVSDR